MENKAHSNQVTEALPDNFNSLLSLTEYFQTEKICLNYLSAKRWNGVRSCPHCNNDKSYSFSDGIRYKCAKCRKQFTAKVGTIFEDSKIPMRKWFIAIYLVTSHKKGISSHQLAKDLELTQKTGWFMLHRIRFALSQGSFNIPIMNDEVQIDETFIGGKNKNRHAKKKVKESQGRSVKDKKPVFGLLNKGIVNTNVVPDTKAKTLKPIIHAMVEKGAIIISDEWGAYNGLNKNYQHEVVKHNSGEFARNGFHTNSLEGFWSLLKRSIYGIYHSVSPEHLQKYTDESAFRYNTRKMNEIQRINCTLVKANGKRLTYKQLIAHE